MFFLAMEYFENGDLRKYVQASKDIPASETDVQTTTRQLLAGLANMHSLGFCHRDLKPEVSKPFLRHDTRPVIRMSGGWNKEFLFR